MKIYSSLIQQNKSIGLKKKKKTKNEKHFKFNWQWYFFNTLKKTTKVNYLILQLKGRSCIYEMNATLNKWVVVTVVCCPVSSHSQPPCEEFLRVAESEVPTLWLPVQCLSYSITPKPDRWVLNFYNRND